MEHKTRLSSLMRLSWEVQRTKHYTRARALQSAWAIILNEDITIYHLVRRHSHTRHPNRVQPQELTLFNPH